MFTSPDAPARLLLIVTLNRPVGDARTRISQALQALGCSELREGVFALGDAAGAKRELIAFAQARAQDGDAVWLMAERASVDGEYTPLVDATDRHASALAAWRLDGAELPLLLPGEMVRL